MRGRSLGIVMQTDHVTSEAQRLIASLRASSVPSVVHLARSAIDQRLGNLQIVLEGGVLRQRYLSDGRLQTMAVYYRDDVINLGDYVGPRKRRPDDLVALGGTVIGYVPDAVVNDFCSQAPGGTEGLSLLGNRELRIAQEWIVALGQLNAIERLAHFMCETLLRCASDPASYKTDRCMLHMTQEMLSAVLGMSAVHVNRTLQELRRLKLADLVKHELIVHDFDGLALLAEFDDRYLFSGLDK